MPHRSADPLTGLPNRTALRAQLREVQDRQDRRVRPCALLSIGIGIGAAADHRNGHAGPPIDHVRQAIATRLQGAVRRGDLLARIGDNRFALISWGSGVPEEMAELALRLLEWLGASLRVDDHLVTPVVHVGITLAPRDGVDPDVLIANAELAMQTARREGGQAWRFFSSEMDEAVRTRIALERDLRHALSRRELALQFQPQQRLSDGHVTGCEALLRWHHPQRGTVSSADFIPLAEQSGLIVPIGRWVLQQACLQAKRWPGEPVVSVNVSPAQFDDEGLLETIRQTLASTGLPAERLELEMTETVLMRDHVSAAETLRTLRSMGVHIALDDFGTGYSSLAYLRSFAIDRLKIDRSFVVPLHEDPGARAIVQAIIDMARALNLSTIAEGIETTEQADTLRARGCEAGQGYLFGSPMSADDFLEHLTARTPS